MRNIEVIAAFADGCTKLLKANSVSTEGAFVLYSYNTPIAQRSKPSGKVVVNATKYSVTTSKAQSYLRYELAKRGIEFVETTKEVPYGRQTNLWQYV